MTRYELVAIEDGEEELVATGTKAKMESIRDTHLADYQEGGELEGDPIPDYRVQPAK